MDHFVLILLALFGVCFLFLAQLRELFRQLARTADDWRRMVETWRNDDGDEDA
jgi:hypothetical protein